MDNSHQINTIYELSGPILIQDYNLYLDFYYKKVLTFDKHFKKSHTSHIHMVFAWNEHIWVLKTELYCRT